VHVSVERVPELERTARGKLRAVISHVTRVDDRTDDVPGAGDEPKWA
jgi:hypothetical protein